MFKLRWNKIEIKTETNCLLLVSTVESEDRGYPGKADNDVGRLPRATQSQ